MHQNPKEFAPNNNSEPRDTNLGLRLFKFYQRSWGILTQGDEESTGRPQNHNF